jgi:probable HAF family extracellular repeat protein
MIGLAGVGSARAAALYTAVDLNSSGFSGSYARSAVSGLQVGDGYGIVTGYRSHATLWRGTAASVIDLNPAGFIQSQIVGTDGSQHVGLGYLDGSSAPRALLWSGTSASAIDLTPNGFARSNAMGVCGGQQVGNASVNALQGPFHAMLWRGTANSAVDLTPVGYTDAVANGTNGAQQIGWGFISKVGTCALLWSGTAESAIDLTPSGYSHTIGYGIGGDQQVGKGIVPGNYTHALLWRGTAESMVDLHPAGYLRSEAMSTNGVQQVGTGIGASTGGKNHALVWSGTAASMIDLHQYLPANWTESYALGIDAQGAVVGYARDASNYVHAFVWTPVPEPSTFVLVGMGVLGVVGFRWRRRK